MPKPETNAKGRPKEYAIPKKRIVAVGEVPEIPLKHEAPLVLHMDGARMQLDGAQKPPHSAPITDEMIKDSQARTRQATLMSRRQQLSQRLAKAMA